MIQVASGLLRGLHLRSPSGKQTRPSSERLRQGIFNVLRHHRWQESSPIMESAVVVDLFGGTGAWGIEAMSNGASEVWFVESHPLALKALQDNLNIAVHGFESQQIEVPKIHVLRKDAAIVYRKLPEARVIFCDPPYEQGWFEKILQLEESSGKLVKDGLFLYEAASKEEVPQDLKTLKHYDTKNYGDSSVHFFIKL